MRIKSTNGTFRELAEVCHNLKTMYKFLGPTNEVGSDGHSLGDIEFAMGQSMLSLGDLISRLIQTAGMYKEITGRPGSLFTGCRIVSHPPGTHFAFPLIGIPPELMGLIDDENDIIG